eukprot:1105085-Alexandrium_andersonii.AAC.1
MEAAVARGLSLHAVAVAERARGERALRLQGLADLQRCVLTAVQSCGAVADDTPTRQQRANVNRAVQKYSPGGPYTIDHVVEALQQLALPVSE